MIKDITAAIAPYQQQLLQHPLYTKIKSPTHLQIFMEHHVFAVWDFMSLLKALQNGLTCTTLPWVPIGDPNTRYLINEIVLAEETDINIHGNRQSHYEMYLNAMKKAGADTHPITAFTNIDFSKYSIAEASVELPIAIQDFLQFTFDVIASNKLHVIAAAFTFGRENLIPEMFTTIIGHIQKNFPKTDLKELKYYFDRHIELDEDEHGPMALEMVQQLCGDDPIKWEEAKEISIASIKKRMLLWNGILKAVENDVLV